MRLRLIIYDIPGREVAVLQNGIQTADTYHVVWNGRDKFNMELVSGVYVYKITAGDNTVKNKITFLR